MFHKNLILRTPSLPFSDNISEKFLFHFFDNPNFAEAVYLASPVLFQEALNWKEGKLTDSKKIKKVQFSLGKYYSRMCSRCTPFGLFAGVGVVDWGGETELEIAENSQRKTRLDMHYAGALAQRLAEIPEIKFSLRYYPNSSIYQIGEDIRYVEYKYVEGKRKHQISAITWSEYIQMVIDLTWSGANISDIIPHLLDDDISEEDAMGFVEQLIDSQLLVNELEPAITGEEFTKQIKKILTPEGNLAKLIDDVDKQLSNIDSNDTNAIFVYQKVIETINTFEIPFEEGKLFQTDLVKLLNKNTLSLAFQSTLEEVFEMSSKIAEPAVNHKLTEFKKRYFERYETQELPILKALDTETGIGYGDAGKSNDTPLTDALILLDKQESSIKISQNTFQQYLFSLWTNSVEHNDFEVVLEEKQLSKFTNKTLQTSPSSSIMFRLTGDKNTPIYIEGISGSSAVNLLGRFAHADENILEIIQNITNQEQAKNPNVIFAEIVHLPENRIGNILLHPPFRNYEIPYLAKSSLTNDSIIPLDDLMVSVDLQKDKVILRSKRLNKEVIPRLSNAHNFSQNSLPLYNFLCDLQYQGIQRNFDLGWSAVTLQAIFSPRLIYKNAILSLASWRLKKEYFVDVITCEPDVLLLKIQNFCQKWKLPHRFVLADFDNELLVNTHNLLSVQIFIDAIKNRDKIELKEFFFDTNNSPVKNDKGQGFTNQFIASWINQETIYQGIDSVNSKIIIQRNFSLGSEWLYFKIYSGTKIADTILAQAIQPLIDQLLVENLIDKWFFIRYADPEKHLRFRVHISDLTNLGKVFLMVKESVQSFENEGLIWKIQVETYQREIERYGSEVMELTETLFCEDSTAVIQMLDQTWGDERELIRWQWGLKVIDNYLTDFGLSLSEKKDLMEKMKISFAQEFNMDKSLKLQIDQKFRDNRQTVERILNNDLNETHEYAPLFQAITSKRESTKLIIDQIKYYKHGIELSKYLSDTIHMTINRIIADNQRTHELIMYDFLYRYYLAEGAKKKGN